MALSKKLRFDVFKRDDFQCQYCGRRSPDVILEVDHIIPKKKGGKDEFENLVTSCFECNRGKGKFPLDKKRPMRDISEDIEMQEEREEQLRQFYKIQKKIIRQKNSIMEEIESVFSEKISDNERGSIRYFLQKGFSPVEIVDAWHIATGKVSPYAQLNPKFRYMCGILHTKLKERDKKNGDK